MNELLAPIQQAAQGYATQWFGPEWGPQAYSAGRALVMIVMVIGYLIFGFIAHRFMDEINGPSGNVKGAAA